MAGLVNRQDDIAAPRKLNCKRILHLARVDIAMNGQYARRAGRWTGGLWDIEQRAHHRPVAAGKTDITYGDAIRRADFLREKAASQNENQPSNCQPPAGFHQASLA